MSLSKLDNTLLLFAGQSNMQCVLQSHTVQECQKLGICGNMYIGNRHIGQPVQEWVGGGDSGEAEARRLLYYQDFFPFSEDVFAARAGLAANVADSSTDGPVSLELSKLIPQVKKVFFVWFQGESDTGVVARYDDYQSNLTRLIAYLRADFGSAVKLGGVICKPHDTASGGGVGYTAVRAAIDNVVSNDPFFVAVETSDLPRVDTVHVTVDGFHILSGRIADALLGLSI